MGGKTELPEISGISTMRPGWAHRRIDQLNVILSIFNEATVTPLGAQFPAGLGTVGWPLCKTTKPLKSPKVKEIIIQISHVIQIINHQIGSSAFTCTIFV